jgi:putative glycosyltransferase (TIGR04348 family)
MARILLVTPARPGSRTGNRITANRWARQLRALGHRVAIQEKFSDGQFDLLLALHARKSATSIRQFSKQQPGHPIVLALTGTDLYHDIHTSNAAQHSLELATRLVMLQPHGLGELPSHLHCKVRVIYQSAPAPTRPPQRLKNAFEVCVSGHLRPVKDPFRAALAARQLPDDSQIRITHLGAALSPSMERKAREEMARNNRYRWFGNVPQWRARQLLARSRLLVVSSKLEGGANVVSEALAANVPVVSTHISGSIGLLGADYPGYFEIGATSELAKLLQRCEREPKFYRRLSQLCQKQAKLLTPAREQAAWNRLIAELT